PLTDALPISPASVLLKRAANIAKGSAEPNRNKVGKVTRKQVEEIAKIKLVDLNTTSLESAMRTVMGTARNMGLEVVEAEEVRAAKRRPEVAKAEVGEPMEAAQQA